MIVPPALFDIGSDTDAGFWLRELPFASFPVTNFNPVDDEGRQFPNGPGSVASDPFFHELRNNPEARRNHA